MSIESCGYGCFVQHGVIPLFSFARQYFLDGFQEASVVAPVNPFQGGELDRFGAPPWCGVDESPLPFQLIF